MNHWIKLGFAVTLSALLTGCGKDDIAPPKDTPPAEIFGQACQACHGENGGGKFGFLLKIAGTDDEVDEITHRIHEGGWIMPRFPNISEAQRQALAMWLKSL